MSDEQQQKQKVSVSVPIGGLVVAAIVALTGAAYFFFLRDQEGEEHSGTRTRTGSMRRKLGLMTAVTLIENDATRKLVVALLRAMARRG